MSKRRAVILLFLVAMSVVAILSLAAYTVQRQNDLNAGQAASFVPLSAASVQTPQVYSTTPPTPIGNDGVDIDHASIQYKLVAGKGFSVEAPIDWNSFQETIDTCTAEVVTDGKDRTVDIWPHDCIPSHVMYTHKVDQGGYSIVTNDTDLSVYNHIVATLELL